MNIINNSFESWGTNGLPVNWTKVNNIVGTNVNTVTVNNVSIDEGLNAVKLTTSNPSVGIEQHLDIKEEIEINIPIKIENGQAFLHLAKADGTNINVITEQQSNWGGTSTCGYRSARLNNGDLAKFFTIKSSSEDNNIGAINISRNGGVPTILFNENGVQQGISGLIQYPYKDIIIYNKVNSEGTCSPYALESSDSFATITRDISLVSTKVSTDTQCYNGLICKNGKTIFPYVSYVGNKYELDVVYSDDDMATLHVLGQYKNANSTRGLMESKAVQINDTTVAILSRSEEGHLIRNDLNLTTMTLGECQITNIATSSTTFTIQTLKNGQHAFTWNAVNINNGGGVDANYPREIICLGFFNADLTEINNISVLATNQSINGTMANGVPYIHSPVVCVDKDNTDDIYVYFERVYSSTEVYTYEVRGKISLLNNNQSNTVTRKTNEWETLRMALPIGEYNLQILSGITANSEFIINSMNESVMDDIRINIDGEIIGISDLHSDSDSMLRINLSDKIANIDLTRMCDNSITINNNEYSLRVFIDGKVRKLPIVKIK